MDVAAARARRARLPADNGLIAFDVGGDIYTGDPADGSVHLVLGGPARESDAAFSPDGTRIALIQSTAQADRDNVVVVGVDGSNPVVVTPQPLLGLTWVDWTPDGRSVALVALVGTKHAFLLADANGSGVRTVVDDMDVDLPVFRPPDGHEVMFSATTPDGVGIYVMKRGRFASPRAHPAHRHDQPRLRPPRAPLLAGRHTDRIHGLGRRAR